MATKVAAEPPKGPQHGYKGTITRMPKTPLKPHKAQAKRKRY